MIEYTSTPDYYNDYICHYGTKGMKWGIRRAKRNNPGSTAVQRLNAMSDNEYWKKVNDAKLVGKKGSSSSQSKSAKGSSEKKGTAGKSSSAKGSSVKESIEKTASNVANKTSAVSKGYTKYLENQLKQVNKSKLPQIRKASAELEKKKKRDNRGHVK